MFRSFFIRPSPGRKFFAEETVQFIYFTYNSVNTTIKD